MSERTRIQRKKDADYDAAPQLAQETRAFMEPRFGFDLGQVQIQHSAPAPLLQPKLMINQPGDIYEQEADRVADAVVNGGYAFVDSPSTTPSVQRDAADAPPLQSSGQLPPDAVLPPPDSGPSASEEMAEGLEEIGKAIQKTPAGRELKRKAEELGAELWSHLEGKVVVIVSGAAALGTLFAANRELPAAIPDIPLDWAVPGLKANLIYEGPLRKPTKVMLTLTLSFGGDGSDARATSRQTSDPQADEIRRFQQNIHYAPGTPEAREEAARQAADQQRAVSRALNPDLGDFARLGSPSAFGWQGENAEASQPNPFQLTPPTFGEDLGRHRLPRLVPELRLDEPFIMRKASGSAEAMTAPPVVQEVLQSSGRPLDDTTRAFMEPRFGQDFGHVRVHTDSTAAQSAKTVSALAYTVGSDVVFGAGQYQPGTDNGKRLIAHELAHVVQQGGFQEPAEAVIRRKSSQTSAAQSAPMSITLAETTDAAAQQTATNALAEVANSRPEDTDRASAAADLSASGSRASTHEPVASQADDESGSNTQPRVASADHGAETTVERHSRNSHSSGVTADAPSQHLLDASVSPTLGPQSVVDLSTGNLALIDEELAEHQRWGTATALVGAAGSAERAHFIAETAAAGSSFTQGLFQGARMGVGIKAFEKIAEVGAGQLATSAAARFSTQAAKFTPLPAVGAVIGGYLSASELVSRDWKTTGESIGKGWKATGAIIDQIIGKGSDRFGKDAEIYNLLANNIEAASTIIEVATQVLNVIGGVIGAISIGMWAITVATAGIASPMAATLSTIAAEIGIAGLVLDAVNSQVLKRLITLFRALHVFTSQADPREVAIQSNAIGQAAAAASGFVGGLAGGWAGGKLAEKGMKSLSSHTPSTPISEHPLSAPAFGEGPMLVAELHSRNEMTDQVTTERSAAIDAEPSVVVDEEALGLPVDSTRQKQSPNFQPATQRLTEVDWYDKELNPQGTVHKEDLAKILFAPQNPAYDASMDPSLPAPKYGYQGALGIPDYTNRVVDINNDSVQFTEYKPEARLDLVPRGGTRYGVRAGKGGAFVDYLFTSREEAMNYASEQATRGEIQIRSEDALPYDWPAQQTSDPNTPVKPAQPGNPVDYVRVFEITAPEDRSLPVISSTIAPQPEGTPAPSRPTHYPGGGAQSQLPNKYLTPESSWEAQYPVGSRPLSYLPPSAHAGAHAGEKEGEPESGLQRNLREFSQLDVRSMTTAEKIMFLAGGLMGTGAAAVIAKRGFDQGRREPIVEHVNPNYPPPPGTPQDLVDAQNQILQTLDARAYAEATASAMAAQESHHRANEKSITRMQESTQQTISATEAHQQAVAHHAASNQQKKQHENQASSASSDYTNQAAKLAAITLPMRGFERFTSLGSSLPDSPDVLQNAKRGILKMHTDSRKFLDQLGKVDNTINQQKASQADREQKIETDAGMLDQADKKALESTQILNRTKQSAQDLSVDNKSRLDHAIQLHKDANRTGAELDAQAEQQKSRAQSLALALDVWAQQHRQARLEALKKTQNSLEKASYKVIEIKEK